MSFLDGLSGDLLVEEDAYLPLDVDGTRVMISGIIDLVHVRGDRIEVVDYKTDRGRHAEAEYRKQLSVYYHVLRELYPEREISASILYTVDGVREEIDPISRDDLVDVVKSVSDVESLQATPPLGSSR
nr:PD-(D/E)XK nuclease family protein [Halalkalicoccus sp. NIPERK01]